MLEDIEEIRINEIFSIINWAMELLEKQSEINIIKKVFKKD